MPDKIRHRKGRRDAKSHVEPTIEEQVRTWYNAHRRSAWWWNGERGGWPNIWMTMAQKFEMPIAAIKNIVGYQGITDRPLPAPLTPDEHRKRQYHKGEQMVEDIHRQWVRDWRWAFWDKEHGK